MNITTDLELKNTQPPQQTPLLLELSPAVYFVVWTFIVAFHAVCAVFLITVAMTYWFLTTGMMPFYVAIWSPAGPQYYHFYGFVYGFIGGIHGARILHIIYLSIRSRQLSLWSEISLVSAVSTRIMSSRLRSCNKRKPRRFTTRLFPTALFKAKRSILHINAILFSRHGLLGVESEYFSTVFLLREVVDVSSQTYQAYRSSKLLPRVALNTFNVALLVTDCWSTAVIQFFLRQSPALQRVVTLLFDALTSFGMVVAVPLMVFISYVQAFSFEYNSFKHPDYLHDTTRFALTSLENRLIFVASVIDLISKIIPHLGIFLSLTTLTELIGRNKGKVLPSKDGQESMNSMPQSIHVQKCSNGLATDGPTSSSNQAVRQQPIQLEQAGLQRVKHLYVFHKWEQVIASVAFLLWGLAILTFHIAAAQRATNYQVEGCRTITRPWFSSGKEPCSSLVYDCHARNTLSPDEPTFEKVDSKTLFGLAIVHCSALHMPTTFQNLTSLMMMHVFNSTIANWDVDSSIAAHKHTRLLAVFMRNVHMREIPTGIMQPLPFSLKSMRISGTNLTALPSDLSTRWRGIVVVTFDDGVLKELPLNMFSINSYVLSFSGNQIATIPALAMMPPGTVIPELRLNKNPLQELPAELETSTPFISSLNVKHTNLTRFPPWIDTQTKFVWAFGTPFCKTSTIVLTGSVKCFDPPQVSSDNDFPVKLFNQLYQIND